MNKMKVLFVLLFMAVGQQLSYGSSRFRSFDAVDKITRQKRSFKGVPKFSDLASDETREAYFYEQTIVISDVGPNRDVRLCKVIEVYEESEAERILEELKFNSKLKVQNVNMVTMMSLLHNCDMVDDFPKPKEKTEETREKQNSPNSITHGIYPGTKWCGLGDIASGYHDLGKRHKIDRCCRAHDFCPIKVLSKDERYNLTNKAVYTKSHCSCDDAFYECLKRDNSWTARFIGNVFFFATAPDCVKGVPENPEVKMQFVHVAKKW